MKATTVICSTLIIVFCQRKVVIGSVKFPVQKIVSNNTVQDQENLNVDERFQQLEREIVQLKTKLEEAVEELKISCESKEGLKDKKSNIPPHVLRVARQVEGFIGFTSYLDHVADHLGIGQTIIYDKVLLNEGNAYNPITGHFTCPLDGYYVFSYTVYTNNIHQVVARLVVDGVNMLDGISDSFHETHEAQGGNFAVLHLKTGQIVSIQNYRWADREIDGSIGDRMSSFSGYMIY